MLKMIKGFLKLISRIALLFIDAFLKATRLNYIGIPTPFLPKQPGEGKDKFRPDKEPFPYYSKKP
jgi:hypothetical protein